MSYTFCRVIWVWISKDPKVKKWVGDHNDTFAYYFQNTYACHFCLYCLQLQQAASSYTLGWTRSSGTSRATRTNWRTEKTKWHWVSERRSGEWDTTPICSECVIKLQPLLFWLIYAHILLTVEVLFFFSQSTEYSRPEYFSFNRKQASHISCYFH